MAAVVAPHPEPRPALRPALRLVVSSTPRPGAGLRAPARLHRADAATYRRRRLVAALVLATVLVGAWLAVSSLRAPDTDPAVLTAASAEVAVPVSTPAAPAPTPAPAVYVVRPGDTVWSIATRLAPDGDVRELVDQLTDRAGGSGLQAGQRIALDGLGV